MAASVKSECKVRLLGLGNEILADDAFGILVAREVERRFEGRLDVAFSSASGFHLMDHLLGMPRLVVVDTVMTGASKPGTIRVFSEKDVPAVYVGSAHCAGIFDVLAVARELHLPAPEEAVFIGVEASDCTTVGGPIHPDVEAAIPKVLDLVERFLAYGQDGLK